jgi:uncharacterized membrane protein
VTEQQQIDDYLTALRERLSPMTSEDREEIVREIQSHIRDSAGQRGASAVDTLARLGPADKLAAQYVDGLIIQRASRSISPLVLLRGAMRLATKGISGILVCFCGFLGYVLGSGFVLSAFAKCLFPTHTGTWVDQGQVVASGTLLYVPQPPAHEILGTWYIPIALTLGSLTLIATTILMRSSLRVSRRWQAKL